MDDLDFHSGRARSRLIFGVALLKGGIGFRARRTGNGQNADGRQGVRE